MRCSGQGVRVFPGAGWQMQAPCDECGPQGTLLGSCLWGQPGPPPPSQASTTVPSPTFSGASRLAGGAWGGQIEGWAGGWGGGSPPNRGRLDVAQIDSPPISSRANLEADQTRNPTAGAVEPGLMPSKPAPPPASPHPEPESQPEPNYPRSRHALRLCGDMGDSLTPPPPRPTGAPPLPRPQRAGRCPLPCTQDRQELDPQAGTSLSHRGLGLAPSLQWICGQWPGAA